MTTNSFTKVHNSGVSSLRKNLLLTCRRSLKTKTLSSFVIALIAFIAGFVFAQSTMQLSKLEIGCNSTQIPLPLPKFLPSEVQHFSKTEMQKTFDVFAQPMEHFPNSTEMKKLFALHSPRTNVQKNVLTSDGTASALDVYLNIVRPSHWKWSKFIKKIGLKKGEGHTATDLKYGQNILFVKAVQDILQYKSFAKICEIGFNIGHSALTWLIADYPLNRTKYLGFSNNHVNQQMCAHELQIYLNLKERKAGVFQVIWGDSTITVPEYTVLATENGTSEMEKCDIVFIDGGHSKETPWRDLCNMRKMVNQENHYLFMDDTCSNASLGHCRAPYQAWKRGIVENITTESFCWETKLEKKRGFCIGKYN